MDIREKLYKENIRIQLKYSGCAILTIPAFLYLVFNGLAKMPMGVGWVVMFLSVVVLLLGTADLLDCRLAVRCPRCHTVLCTGAVHLKAIEKCSKCSLLLDDEYLESDGDLNV